MLSLDALGGKYSFLDGRWLAAEVGSRNANL